MVNALAMILTSGTRGRMNPPVVVIGGDRRVGAVPFGFRREGENDEAR